MEIDKVFVYGTLKKKFSNHIYLGNSKFLGKDTIEGFELHRCNNGIPFIINGEGEVTGEVYKINRKTLQTLDWLEGEGQFYKRILVNTMFGMVWVYVIDNQKYETIKKDSTKIINGVYNG